MGHTVQILMRIRWLSFCLISSQVDWIFLRGRKKSASPPATRMIAATTIAGIVYGFESMLVLAAFRLTGVADLSILFDRMLSPETPGTFPPIMYAPPLKPDVCQVIVTVTF